MNLALGGTPAQAAPINRLRAFLPLLQIPAYTSNNRAMPRFQAGIPPSRFIEQAKAAHILMLCLYSVARIYASCKLPPLFDANQSNGLLISPDLSCLYSAAPLPLSMLSAGNGTKTVAANPSFLSNEGIGVGIGVIGSVARNAANRDSNSPGGLHPG